MAHRVFNVGGTIPGTHPHISSFAKLDLPIKTGLAGAYVLGGTLALSLRNRANPAAAPLAIGTPVINPLFGATLQHENCIETLLPQTVSRTWIFIYKPQNLSGNTAANRAPLAGNRTYVASAMRGDQMYMEGGALYSSADRNADTAANVAQVISGLDPTKWAAAVGIVDGVAGTQDSLRRQSGVSTWVSPVPAPFTGRAVFPDRTIRLGADGAGPPGIYAHTVEIGIFVPHTVALSRTDTATQVNYLSQWMGENFDITDV